MGGYCAVENNGAWMPASPESLNAASGPSREGSRVVHINAGVRGSLLDAHNMFAITRCVVAAGRAARVASHPLQTCKSGCGRMPTNVRHFVDRPAPTAKTLSKAILGVPSSMLMISTKDSEAFEKLRVAAFESLDLPFATDLPDVYEDSRVYHRTLASLVVEETLFTIVQALESNFVVTKDEKKRKRGVLVRMALNDPKSKDFFQCFTHAPLYKGDRSDLRAGTVVALIPKGAQIEPANMTFGIIQYGSLESRSCK